MIDEQRHDLAIEYLLGHLEGDACREFEAWMQSDDELRALVDEMTEATAALAQAVPQTLPPPHLRARVLAAARGESAPPADSPARKTAWIPWTLAAGFAAACTFLYVERTRWRTETQNAEGEMARAFATAQSGRDQVARLGEQVLMFQTQTQTHIDQIAELRDEVVKLRGRNALAQVKIATLGTQVAEFARAGVTVVWDPQDQRGVVKIANLPKAAAGQDYQLWVIDPKYPSPVSGGVVVMADAGPTSLSFKPDQFIENAAKFAISVEKTGGAPNASGPIIFLSE